MNIPVYGTKACENDPPICEGGFVTFQGICRGFPSSFGISQKSLCKNILYVGGTGTGKTNTINMSVDQIKRSMGADDVMIVFDTKGDFEKTFFQKSRGDLIIGNSAKYRGRSERWNVYREIQADGSDDENIMQNINEIARALFINNHSTQNPFFPNAARNLFSGYLLAILRSARTNRNVREKLLNNRELSHFFNTARQDSYDKLANSYRDLRSLKMYLGDYNNNQALGVLSEVLNMVKDTFLGVFNEKGDFSIREFVRNRGGRTLFLEYDLAIGQTLAPLYSLLLDLAIKEVLSQNEDVRGHVYIVLDEMRLAPYIRQMENAVNFGRGRNLSIQAGLQSLNQIYDSYGVHRGGSMLSGFNTVIAFRLNDTPSRAYIRDYFGTNYLREIGEPAEREFRTGYVVEDWELNELQLGDAVISVDGSAPFCFHFEEFKNRR